MPSIHQHGHWHRHGGYEQYPHSFLRGAPSPAAGASSSSSSSSADAQHSTIISHDDATELLNELGTTENAIGDATAEFMITTPGKIPNEMYDLDDTTMGQPAVAAAPAAAMGSITGGHGHAPCPSKAVIVASTPGAPVKAAATPAAPVSAGAHQAGSGPTAAEAKQAISNAFSGFAAHSTVFLVLALLLLLLLLICCILACVFSRMKRCGSGSKNEIDCDEDSSEPLLGTPNSDSTPKSCPTGSSSEKKK